ncbi:hypothetical protein VE26_04650 [Devosia chinhatensis]|uniref:Uncharacterized protein n=1 Tax=Devosia chinhatensis TaxID=429727 RepID=A0A0F5FN49_9HYPH|nr:hypothetical protein VE26_04650 [Devosia chinhatensis]
MPRPRPDRSATPQDAGTPAASTAATEAISAFADIPQPVTLSAVITEGGAPIQDGLIWRVFESEPTPEGEMALVTKAETGPANIELRPGEYVLHVSYGRAQLSEPLSVVPGQNRKDVILDAGALRLNSEVTGEVPISPAMLSFDIFTEGSEANRSLIAENVSANEIVTLNAGTYHIVSHFGSINAVVRADLRVEAGQLTDATLYHHASEVALKLVSEEGGEAIADVEWTIKTADGTTVFTERSAFPSTVLAEGEYLVLAKMGDQVYNRDLEVKPGPLRQVEVLTAAF